MNCDWMLSFFWAHSGVVPVIIPQDGEVYVSEFVTDTTRFEPKFMIIEHTDKGFARLQRGEEVVWTWNELTPSIAKVIHHHWKDAIKKRPRTNPKVWTIWKKKISELKIKFTDSMEPIAKSDIESDFG